jgi:hypothetical protein
VGVHHAEASVNGVVGRDHRCRGDITSSTQVPLLFMSPIKRILFPVDFSESCLGTARYVEAFAGQFDSEIMLLHSVGVGEHNLAEEAPLRRQAQLDAFLTDELKVL